MALKLSDKARVLADQRAFPRLVSEAAGSGGGVGPQEGMTYQQWLIGMALASGMDATSAIVAADEVLEELVRRP